jgi:hypothetical protein
VAYHLSEGGYGQAQDVIKARTGVRIGPAQLAGIAADLAAWTGDFYDQRARGADTGLPVSDVIMMQADGKGISMLPQYRASAGKATDAAHPGIKKLAGVIAVADFTPAVREPEDIAAPPARRKEHPGPQARDKWVSASITASIEEMIGLAYDHAGQRDPLRARQRVFLGDGNKQQITAIGACARARGLKVPVLIDFIHVSGLPRQSRRSIAPRQPAGRQRMGGRAAAAGPAQPRQRRRRHPGVRRCQGSREEQPLGLGRRGQGRHLPDEQPHAHEVRHGTRERLADRHRDDRGSLPIRPRTDSVSPEQGGLPTGPKPSSSSAPWSSTETSTTT